MIVTFICIFSTYKLNRILKRSCLIIYLKNYSSGLFPSSKILRNKIIKVPNIP